MYVRVPLPTSPSNLPHWDQAARHAELRVGGDDREIGAFSTGQNEAEWATHRLIGAAWKASSG